MKVVAVGLAKGGTGKTTTCVNLAGALARLGARVLVVDLDPQGDASTWLGVPDDAETILDALEDGLDLDEVAHPTGVEGVEATLADPRLGDSELDEGSLSAWLASVEAGPEAPDVVLLDLAPGWIWSTRAAAAAAAYLLVPTKPDLKSMRGAPRFIEAVHTHGLGFGRQLEVLGVFLNDMTKGRVENRQARRDLRDAHGFGDLVLTSEVHSWVATKRAEDAHTSVFELGGEGKKAASEYERLARELVTRGLTWE